MHITPLSAELLPQAAAIFVRQLAALRQVVPSLPSHLEAPERVLGLLQGITQRNPGVAAVQEDRLLGYMTWYLVDNFRATRRKAAYCPEWAHGVVDSGNPGLYRLLYKAAAPRWTEAGCQVHAMSLLAHDRPAIDTWFWNGFGLAVVDAVRPLTPLAHDATPAFKIQRAGVADIDLLASLDMEHRSHYSTPPTLMAAHPPLSRADFAEFLGQSKNRVWLAMQGAQVAGFLILEASSFGAADIVNSQTTIAITGAYVRPAYRGQGAAAALLRAALSEAAQVGYERCSVDFESFNPEAAAFWPRYFTPVCYSLLRVPENW